VLFTTIVLAPSMQSMRSLVWLARPAVRAKRALVALVALVVLVVLVVLGRQAELSQQTTEGRKACQAGQALGFRGCTLNTGARTH
jgi:hypothetical protein